MPLSKALHKHEAQHAVRISSLLCMQRMAQDGILGAVVRGLPAAKAEGDALSAPTTLAWHLLSLDTGAHQPFAMQFMQAGGLSPDMLTRCAGASRTCNAISMMLIRPHKFIHSWVCCIRPRQRQDALLLEPAPGPLQQCLAAWESHASACPLQPAALMFISLLS